MPMDRFLIAPITGGLENNQKPWLIPDDAFSRLNNAYIFRGRVRKRFGSRLMNSDATQNVAQLYSRLRLSLGTIGSGGSTSFNIPGSGLAIGQIFSVGTDIFTVYQLGTNVATLSSNPAVSATINSNASPNTVTITGEPNTTPAYYYPSTPVMGFITYETAASGTDPVFVFDTQFAYQYGVPVSGAFNRVGTAVWTGSDSQFFSGTTWGADTGVRNLFVVNNNPTDEIQYWNGSSWTQTTFTISNDGMGNVVTLESALLTVVFKNYLLMLNTWESLNGASPTHYTNRIRWAAFGDPLATNAWRQDMPGNGNALDAGTMEDIVSCCFIKDRLIVFFERSTWEFTYTGNNAQPFTWQKLNTELGAESTFSTVPFDQVCITVGNVGIHACNGVNVKRVDDKIPDTVWAIHEGATNVNRVYGVRDYYAEQIYWTFPNTDTNQYSSTYPNKILVFNYKTGSWAFNDDSITAFGYYYAQAASAITWSSLDVTWDNNEVSWDSGTSQSLNEQVIAGNQEGFVFIVDSNVAVNAPALSITNITLTNEAVEGTTNGSGNLSGTVAGSSGSLGDYFYVGAQKFTVTMSSGSMTVSGTGPGGAAGTFNISTGVFALTGADTNTPVLYFARAISSNVVLTVINHNLNVSDFIYVEYLNGLTGPFLSLYQVISISDANTFIIEAPDIAGVLATGQLYSGGGVISRLSRIDMLTKQFNFYVDKDKNATVQRVDFLVDRTANGEFTVDSLLSTVAQGILNSAISNNAIQGTGIVETSPYNPAYYPYEQYQERLWHPSYLNAEGNAIQFRIYLSDTEMVNFGVVTAPFQLHAMAIYTQATRDRLE